MKPTVKDVAREAGVSTATVSNVLTQKKYVSDEITLRVKKAMEKLGYKPNSIARSLKVNRTFKIGIIVPNITNPFFGEIVEEAGKVADEHGFQIILCASDYDINREKKIIDNFASVRVDGIIDVAPIMLDSKLEKERHTPMVIVDRPHFSTENNMLGFVYADNYKASADVADYLLKQGYRKFVCVSGYGELIPNARCRRDGFCDELKRQGIAEKDILIYYSDFSFEGGYKSMQKFMCEDLRTEKYGAFISSDVMAWGGMEALKNGNYRIPEDIGVIGYDNIYYSNFLSPKLTTVENPTKELGNISMNILIDAIENGKMLNGKYYTVGTSLIQRQSTQ